MVRLVIYSPPAFPFIHGSRVFLYSRFDLLIVGDWLAGGARGGYGGGGAFRGVHRDHGP